MTLYFVYPPLSDDGVRTGDNLSSSDDILYWMLIAIPVSSVEKILVNVVPSNVFDKFRPLFHYTTH
jgi:hypothetical protein